MLGPVKLKRDQVTGSRIIPYHPPTHKSLFFFGASFTRNSSRIYASPMSSLTLRTDAAFVISKEGILVLGFWQLMEFHHLNCSLLFGQTYKITGQYIRTNKETLQTELERKFKNPTMCSLFIVLLEPSSCRSKPLRVKIALSLFSLSLQPFKQHVRTT